MVLTACILADSTDKALTNDEKKQVSNIFTALDSNHDGKLAHYGELYTLLRTVRTTFPYYSPMYQTISHSVYYDADVNKDGYVTKQEFSAAVTTLKNANPMGFPSFLKGRSLAVLGSLWVVSGAVSPHG